MPTEQKVGNRGLIVAVWLDSGQLGKDSTVADTSCEPMTLKRFLFPSGTPELKACPTACLFIACLLQRCTNYLLALKVV